MGVGMRCRLMRLVWVHPDDVMEAKTYIVRHLPSLVFSSQSPTETETTDTDPTVNSLYFDSPTFSLYKNKVTGAAEASSLRIRWYGQLRTNPQLFIELKIVHANGSSEERVLPIKEKYIQRFLRGEYAMDKTLAKMVKQGQPGAKIDEYRNTVTEIQAFIREHRLQPVLRANYTRTAYQKPADDRVRIALDSNLAFIREDCLDDKSPCREPHDWHRTDVDGSAMTYPFAGIRGNEISRFPYAVLEIKVKEDRSKKMPPWITELMASHLVHKIPRFSKFLQGGASLFEDLVDDYPAWHSLLETDIRTDPQTAFEQEEERKAKQAADDMVVGSFFRGGGGAQRSSFSQPPALSSPLAKSNLESQRLADEALARSSSLRRLGQKSNSATPPTDQSHDAGPATTTSEPSSQGYGTIFPSFTLPKYARKRRESAIKLPPGVVAPGVLIKDSGPLQVEPKVWLANERTFLKWQHICVLLGSLAISLYSAGGSMGDTVAEAMGVAYVLIAAFAGFWGYTMHRTRRTMIVERSGKDFDHMFGPVVVCLALIVALFLNLILAVCCPSSPRLACLPD